MNITYVKGDATQPIGDGNKIICHICNDIGVWGAGFVLALSKRWSNPEEDYRAMFTTPGISRKHRTLGTMKLVPVEYDAVKHETILVANMIGQRGVNEEGREDAPIRYGAVRTALAQVNDFAFRMGYTLHMPRIGCGLAGGEWTEIEKILNEVCSVDVTVYDFD